MEVQEETGGVVLCCIFVLIYRLLCLHELALGGFLALLSLLFFSYKKVTPNYALSVYILILTCSVFPKLGNPQLFSILPNPSGGTNNI